MIAQTTMSADPVLCEIVRRLVETFRPNRVFLFGSRGRGESGPDSDYDVMVLVDETQGPGYKLAQRANEVLRGVRASVDVLVWSRQRFESRLHLAASLPATIAREGSLLYAA